MDEFEEMIQELTKPINSQLPRPWMTRMKNPLEADVFIVGMNQRNAYSAEDIPRQRHLDALFNRNGESCRGHYDEVTNGKPSPTRRNIDGLSDRLDRRGIHNVIETDVICFSTPLAKDLENQANAGGARKGEEIFRYLLGEIAPTVIVIHGVRAVKRISCILKVGGLAVPRSAAEICDVQTEKYLILPIPSLAPPAFNRWSSWSEGYLDEVADRVRDKLAT